MKRVIFGALCCIAASAPAIAGWQVNNEFSQVSFTSVKNHVVGEAHIFKQVGGELSSNGAFQLTLPLSSVESLIPIRNERMRAHLFETAKFPELTVNAKVDMTKLKNMMPGESVKLTLQMDVALHGVDQLMSADVMVTKTSKTKLLVNSLKPVIVSPNTFGLDTGVEKLKQLASLSDITLSVPVSFVLTLEKQ